MLGGLWDACTARVSLIAAAFLLEVGVVVHRLFSLIWF
jgi:hypothetical protein